VLRVDGRHSQERSATAVRSLLCVSTFDPRKKPCILAPYINRQKWKLQATALYTDFNNIEISLFSRVSLPVLHGITKQQLSAKMISATRPDVASAEKRLHFARNPPVINIAVAPSSFHQPSKEGGSAAIFRLASENVHSCSYLLSGAEYPSLHEHAVYDPSLTPDSQINVWFLICELERSLTSTSLAMKFCSQHLCWQTFRAVCLCWKFCPLTINLILKNLLSICAVNVFRVKFIYQKGGAKRLCTFHAIEMLKPLFFVRTDR
jgi:hypothetical protein